MKRLAPVVLLVALAGLVLADDRSDAEKNLSKAIGSQNRSEVVTALGAATKAGDLRAAKLIVSEALKLRDLRVHEELLAAIKGITEEAGVKELAEAGRKSPQLDLRYLLVEGLALQGSELAQKTVLEALDDKDLAVASVAARSSRGIKTADAVEKLIARLEKAESKPQEATLAREITGALVAITGHEDITFALEWKGWWKDHKATWKPGETAAAPKPSEGEGATSIDRLKKNRPEDARTIERMSDDDVIVVKGHSDQIEDVLKAIKVPHKAITADEVANLKLDPKSVLVLNCNSRNNPYGDAEWAKIREFVDKGGYLFSSDWQLEFLFGKVFPGSIVLDKKVGKDKMTVGIKPTVEGGKHPLMRDVFPMTTWDADKFTWHVDGHSELIKIESPGVTVLAESPDLQKQFQNGAVAVTFRWHNGKVVTGNAGRQATGGKSGHDAPQGGCVLHVLGHFKHQKDKNSGDHFALQQLLLNFFLEKKHGAVPGGN